VGDAAAFEEAAVAVEADVVYPVGAVQVAVADFDLVAGRALAEGVELAAGVEGVRFVNEDTSASNKSIHPFSRLGS